VGTTGGRAQSRSILWLFPALLAILIGVYSPALHGTLLWDDDGHITPAALRGLNGVWQIWTKVGATQQYYPLTHTAFWLQWHLWGDAFTGYHLTNVVLHALSAVLLAVILRRLRIPGAILAAVVFALHPVQVESVAWMTELKNMLSGVFYFAAALSYMRFDEKRTRGAYLLAVALFVAALLSKTVTATLPPVLLIAMWWKYGTLEWRRDARPLVPFFAIGAIAGLATSWIERSLIGAEGREFAFSPIERVLIAGRAVVFYAGKLVWPANLTFIYPRWNVSESAWWQYVFPVGVALVLVVLWRGRDRSRAPLAAGLIFIASLFPVLGFLNVYPFRYSFVADHFQYLACAGLIVPVAAGLVALLSSRARLAPAVAEAILCVSIGTLLAGLSYREAGQYASAEALYSSTILRNPSCWLCQENLGILSLHDVPPRREEAVDRFRQALRIYADDAQVHYNLGTTLMELGQLDESAAQLQQSVTLAPGYAEAYGNRGVVLQRLGRMAEARDAYRTALDIKPELTFARANLSVVLNQLGQHDEAVRELHQQDQTEQPAAPAAEAERSTRLADAAVIAHDFAGAVTYYREALRQGSIPPLSRLQFAVALSQTGDLDEAVVQLDAAIRESPNDSQAHAFLGEALLAKHTPERALHEFQESVRLGGNTAAVHNDLGVALATLGRTDEAVREFHEALRLQPDYPQAEANLAKALTK
jgi:tetratricopeptide (TPR) repeat protein